ncbi:hypothetical protein [Calothrix rhizosoleniae]|nr:hypothetical protein [Calothrix rhizosoleniae]
MSRVLSPLIAIWELDFQGKIPQPNTNGGSFLTPQFLIFGIELRRC